MRHLKAGRKLGRNAAHRLALYPQPGAGADPARADHHDRGEGQGGAAVRREADHAGQEGHAARPPAGDRPARARRSAEVKPGRRGRRRPPHRSCRSCSTRSARASRTGRAATRASSSGTSAAWATPARRPSSSCSRRARPAPAKPPAPAPKVEEQPQEEEQKEEEAQQQEPPAEQQAQAPPEGQPQAAGETPPSSQQPKE